MSLGVQPIRAAAVIIDNLLICLTSKLFIGEETSPLEAA